MSFSLVALNGPEPGRVHRLSQGVACTVGSDAACDICIDGTASQHARLQFVGDRWQVRVCHSGHRVPTAVNSRHVKQAALQHGDLLTIGDQWLVFSDDQQLGDEDGVVLQSCRVLGRRSLGGRRAGDALNKDRASKAGDSCRAVNIPRASNTGDTCEEALGETWFDDSSTSEELLDLVARVSQVAGSTGVEALGANVKQLLEGSLEDVSAQVCFDLKRGGDPLTQWVRQRGELLIMELGRSAVSPIRGVEEKVGVIGAPIFVHGKVSACLELRLANGSRATGALLDCLVAIAGILGLRLQQESNRTKSVAPQAVGFPNPSRGRSRVPLQTPHPNLPSAGPTTKILGESLVIRRLQEQIQRAAPTDANVLVLGESGTGKELVAQTIHEQSRRRRESFVAVNCAAFTESLLESELFGHEQGAFTGAEAKRIGQFERADQGTIFLDEIGELSSGCQAKLLRLLEGEAFYRVGGVEPVQVDVRIVAATHRDLPQMVADGLFREDLWYRLRVIELQTPPLRHRRDDILGLANHFLTGAQAAPNAPRQFSDAAVARLEQHPWPGNVRELRNAVERAVVMSSHPVIQPEDLGLDERNLGGDDCHKDSSVTTLAENERRHILRVMELVDGNKTEACKLLDISRTTLYSKLAKQDR